MKVIAIIALCLIAAASAAQVTLSGVLRDFTLNHPDFGTYTQAETGAIQSTLDQDGKPVLNAGTHTSFYAPYTYAMWFRSVANINIEFGLYITLDSGSGSEYTYSNPLFYPVDGEGWGNEGNTGHNLYFTAEFENFFTYMGGETFSFSTQDDMWVFVNDNLVLDLGGVHSSAVSGSIAIDSLGLQSGSDVNIKILYAQRHNAGANGGSTFSITTTAVLQNFPSGEPIPVPGRDALICEVLYQNFCPGTPVGSPDDTVTPSKRQTCPSDPTFTFPDDSGTPSRTAGLEYGFENFNVISFDDFFCPSGDIEGRLAVRNNINVADFSVGYELRTGGVTAWDNSLPFSAVIGHDAVWSSGAVYPDGSGSPFAGAEEDIFVGGSFTASSDLTLRRTGSCSSDGCLDDQFDNAQSYYSAVSDAFATVVDNAVAQIQYTEFKLTCSDSSSFSYSVTVNDVDFSTVTYYTVVGCNRFAQIVINIVGTGSSITFAGDDITHDSELILFNIVGAGKVVHVTTQVNGNILAPNHQYYQDGGVVVGQVIVGNVQRLLQVNRVHCVSPAPGPHPPSSDLCPSFETDCLGLDFPMDQGVYSFRDFNVITFGSFVANTGDIEGRLAARNSVSLGAGFSIGYQLSTANNIPDNDLPYSLVAGGDVTWISGSIFPDGTGVPFPGNREDMFVGGAFTGSNDLALRVHGPCGSTGCLDSYFDSAKSCYEGYQSALGSQPDNVDQTVMWSGLFLTCQDATADVYFVTLTSDVMAQYTYTSVDNCNFQAYWVINIAGNDDVSIGGASFPAICGGVVYNILGSGRTVTITETSVCGHVLAPDNIVYQPGGVIVGKVVAGDITMSLQINKQNNCPNPGTVNLPTANTAPAPAGQDYLQLASRGNIQPNDIVTIGQQSNVVVSFNGNQMQLNSALSADVPAGSIIVATVSNANGRPIESNESASSSQNSASSVAVVASFVLALIALAF